MRFIDMNDARIYTLQDIHREWKVFREEDPENHAADFRTEIFEILMATVNGRNDLEIIGPTAHTISAIIARLRAQL